MIEIENVTSSFPTIKILSTTGVISLTSWLGNLDLVWHVMIKQRQTERNNPYLECWNIAKEIGKFLSIHSRGRHNEFHISSTRNYLGV